LFLIKYPYPTGKDLFLNYISSPYGWVCAAYPLKFLGVRRLPSKILGWAPPTLLNSWEGGAFKADFKLGMADFKLGWLTLS